MSINTPSNHQPFSNSFEVVPLLSKCLSPFSFYPDHFKSSFIRSTHATHLHRPTALQHFLHLLFLHLFLNTTLPFFSSSALQLHNVSSSETSFQCSSIHPSMTDHFQPAQAEWMALTLGFILSSSFISSTYSVQDVADPKLPVSGKCLKSPFIFFSANTLELCKILQCVLTNHNLSFFFF